eukprot:COSAG03_NODE_2141_length_3084_cov_3.577128_1_plen_151_part_00
MPQESSKTRDLAIGRRSSRSSDRGRPPGLRKTARKRSRDFASHVAVSSVSRLSAEPGAPAPLIGVDHGGHELDVRGLRRQVGILQHAGGTQEALRVHRVRPDARGRGSRSHVHAQLCPTATHRSMALGPIDVRSASTSASWFSGFFVPRG